MPLYEYQCRACRKTAEVRHGFKEAFEGKCEVCGGEMARVFTPAGIVFKGSGFYLTDSRSAAEAKSAAATKKSTSTSSETPAAPVAAAESSPSTTAPAATPAPAAASSVPSKSESAA